MASRATPAGRSLGGRPVRVLPRAVYLVDALTALDRLMGMILVNETPEGTAAGRIVEAEAYVGAVDKASHSFGPRRTARTEIQWAEGGHAYVYTIHTRDLFNVTVGPAGVHDVVLVRALEPVEGIDLMRRRRGIHHDDRQLCSGPGKLCQALGITRGRYGWDLTRGHGLWLADDGTRWEAADLVRGPRIGIDYAEEFRDVPWRLHRAGNPHVSRRPSPRRARPPRG